MVGKKRDRDGNDELSSPAFTKRAKLEDAFGDPPETITDLLGSPASKSPNSEPDSASKPQNQSHMK